MGDLRSALKDPKQRRKLLIVVAGVGGLLLFLHLRNKGNPSAAQQTGTSTPANIAVDGSIDPATGVPYASELAAAQAGAAGGFSSGAGAGTTTGNSAPAFDPTPFVNALTTDSANWSNVVTALIGAGKTQVPNSVPGAPAPGSPTNGGSPSTPPPSQPSRTPSQPPGAVTPQTVSVNGHMEHNPRAGLHYNTTKYKGHTVHEYGQAVPGGVGPKRNLIVVG